MADKADNTTEVTEGKETKTEPTSTQEKGDTISFDEGQQAIFDKAIGKAKAAIQKQAKADYESKVAADQAKADKDKEAADLIAKGDFDKALKLSTDEVATLTTSQEADRAQLKAYGDKVTSLLSNRIKELGEEAQKAIDGLPGDLDALTKLTWIDENAGLFATKQPPKGPPTKKGRASGAEVKKFEKSKIYVPV